jgi:hypothetical protein
MKTKKKKKKNPGRQNAGKINSLNIVIATIRLTKFPIK